MVSMDVPSSQILSHFKLFSKISNLPESKQTVVTLYSKWTVAVVCIIVVSIIAFGVGLIYYAERIQSHINESLRKFILKSHLHPSGEFVTTYVPEDFMLLR